MKGGKPDVQQVEDPAGPSAHARSESTQRSLESEPVVGLYESAQDGMGIHGEVDEPELSHKDYLISRGHCVQQGATGKLRSSAPFAISSETQTP